MGIQADQAAETSIRQAGTAADTLPSTQQPAVKPTVYRILLAISLVHLLNDTIQSIIPAIMPILKDSMKLNFVQVGAVAFALNITAAVLQPLIGYYSDRRPSPFLLPLGMALTCIGVLGLALSQSYWLIILSVVCIGIGSAVFHPEASRVAYFAAGSQRGLAQSIFQVGGNSGQALASVMTIFIFARLGQLGAIWFTFAAGAAIAVQLLIARWYGRALVSDTIARKQQGPPKRMPAARRKQIGFALILLIAMVFARSWYHAGVTLYYPFWMMDHFGYTLERVQLYILLFTGAGVFGTFMGGALSDRFGRRNLIFFSMLGAVPFALMLPYLNPFWAYFILPIIGFIILSSFSVTVVYAQELMPGRIGTVSGLILGLAFGLGALGSLALGGLSNWLGVDFVIQTVSFLPLLGLLTLLLPSDRKLREWSEEAPSQ